jgi:hypothetical protein
VCNPFSLQKLGRNISPSLRRPKAIITAAAFLGAFLVCCARIVCGQDAIARKSSQSIEEFCKSMLPEETEFAHPPLQIAFGPSKQNIVMLFIPANGDKTTYTGWVLAPSDDAGQNYRKYVLPQMGEIPDIFDIDVQAVFGSRVGTNHTRDLVVLYRFHRAGRPQDDGYASYVYHWNGTAFETLPKIQRLLVGLQTAEEVRKKLASVH